MSASPAALQQYLKVGSSLPPRLKRFFLRYPPQNLQPTTDAPISADGSTTTTPIVATDVPKNMVMGRDGELEPSPFAPHKNSETGAWQNPRFSLRRQADLVKLAREHGVEGLLPFTTKGTEERIRKRLENGLRVKGTGVGQRVKGHKWEREMIPKLEERRKAMLEMSQLVQTWKQRGHGRGIKKWPK